MRLSGFSMGVQVALVSRYWTKLFVLACVLSYFLVFPFEILFPLVEQLFSVADSAQVRHHVPLLHAKGPSTGSATWALLCEDLATRELLPLPWCQPAASPAHPVSSMCASMTSELYD